jgi:hypothetical protein
MKTSKPKAAPKDEAPELPPISEMMQKLLKGFQAQPGHWFYHIDQFAADVEAQLVSRGLVIRDEIESKGRKLVRYCGKPDANTPPAVEL